MKKQGMRFLFKFFAVSATLIFACAVIFYGVRLFVFSDFFTVKEVISRGTAGLELGRLKGRNIFSLDLRAIADQFSFAHPVYKRITLVKVLPSRVYVRFLERTPLAYVRLYKYFFVDEEGVLMDAAPAATASDLPVISGLESKLLNPKAGKRYYADELICALRIIQQIAAERQLRPLRILRVDVVTRADISVYLVPAGKPEIVPVGKRTVASQAIEVKIGHEAIVEKIKILGELLAHFKNDWNKIKYIDVRFKEPAVKFLGY